MGRQILRLAGVPLRLPRPLSAVDLLQGRDFLDVLVAHEGGEFDLVPDLADA